MNTKAVISAIEHAMERTVNYLDYDQKIAFLDGLAAACEYPHPDHPMMPLETQWKKIKEHRALYVKMKQKAEEEREAERIRLLTTYPSDASLEEESVFDAVPDELRDEVKAMDLAPEEAVVVENPFNTVLDMARAILTPSDLQQAIDRTKREPVELHEPTAEDLAKIMQDKAAFVTGMIDGEIVAPTNHEELGKAMFDITEETLARR